MRQPIIVQTTCDQREILEKISSELVEFRLAACCQINGPMTSIYHWEGKVVHSQEWICSIKTVFDCLDQVSSEIKRMHSYEEPEIVATQIVGGSESYLNWIKSEVSLENDG